MCGPSCTGTLGSYVVMCKYTPPRRSGLRRVCSGGGERASVGEFHLLRLVKVLMRLVLQGSVPCPEMQKHRWAGGRMGGESLQNHTTEIWRAPCWHDWLLRLDIWTLRILEKRMSVLFLMFN